MPWEKSLAGLQANIGSGRLQVVCIKATLASFAKFLGKLLPVSS